MWGSYWNMKLDSNGKAVQGTYGKYLRHPFSGVSIAEECGVPAEVCHIIATHAGEGNMVKRTTEAYVVHHADFYDLFYRSKNDYNFNSSAFTIIKLML